MGGTSAWQLGVYRHGVTRSGYAASRQRCYCKNLPFRDALSGPTAHSVVNDGSWARDAGRRSKNGKTRTTGHHQDGAEAGGFGEQTPQPGRWTRRSNSRDRHGIPKPRDGPRSGRPPDRELRGSRSVPLERSEGHDRDQLRRIPAQPQGRETGRLASRDTWVIAKPTLCYRRTH